MNNHNSEIKFKKDHNPVLPKEIEDLVKKIQPKESIDFTFGAGGHSRIILENSNTNLLAIDRDLNTKKYTDSLYNIYGERFQYVNDISYNMIKYKKNVDFILGDLGLSQMQLGGNRGFAYNKDSPLDMCMGLDSIGPLASLLPAMTEENIGDIIRDYGEEKRWRKISKEIFYNRMKINSTLDLKNIIISVVKDDYKVLSRCFQAFRIFINREMDVLEKTLKIAYDLLIPGGYLLIITFHSLEDRIVKHFFKYYLKNLEFIIPSDEEIQINSQCRSAKLRIGQKNNE